MQVYFAGDTIPAHGHMKNVWVHVLMCKDGKVLRLPQFSDTAATRAAFSNQHLDAGSTAATQDDAVS